MQLARHGPHPDDGLQRVTQRCRVNVDGVMPDHAALFQPAQTLRHAGGRQPHLLGELLERDAGIGQQDVKNALINGVTPWGWTGRQLETKPPAG